MIYDYKCSACNHEFTKSLPIADYKVPCNSTCTECGVSDTIYRYINSVPMMTGLRGHGGLENKFKNLSGDWKDIMKAIKKGNPGSTIRDY